MQAIKQHVPPELQALPCWVVWRYEERGGKRTKVPYSPVQRDKAKSNDPGTWGTFTQAESELQRRAYDGVGLMFDGAHFGVDIDHCIDTQTGEVTQQALDIVSTLASYTEISPSGTGLHILCKGTLPTQKGRRQDAVEVYGRGRYFTMTGKPWGNPRPLQDGTAAIQGILADMDRQTSIDRQQPATVQPSPVALDDGALLDKIRQSKQGTVFGSLWRGDISSYPSHSEADLALCNLLAFWTGKDAGRMDALFRASGLMRDKWDKHPTYAQDTVQRAIQGTAATYGQGATVDQAFNGVDAPENPLFRRYREAYAQVYGYASSKGMVWGEYAKRDGSGEVGLKPLSTFAALVSEEVTRDDGADVCKEFVLEGVNKFGAVLPPASVPAAKYAAMGWVGEQWGTQASILPGQMNKDKMRYAVVEASHGTVQRRTVYTHTGWRKINGHWAYMYHGGAVGAANVSVELEGTLAAYSLPETDMGQQEAAQASVDVLDFLPLHIGVPLLAHMYLAPLCEFLQQAGIPPAYVLYLSGNTGTRKSTVAALALAHFGANFQPKQPPASFNDTANATRRKAFLLKDAPLLVDDYHPTFNGAERARMASTAQNLARAWGDRAERGRMRADATLQTAQPPRGLGLMTGEDLPDIGESGTARFYLVDVQPGDIPTGEALTGLQARARGGALAQAMRCYIDWIRGQADQLPNQLRERFHTLRDWAMSAPGLHGRLYEAVAWLLVGYEYMLGFWQTVGAITEDSRQALWKEGHAAIMQNVQQQQKAMQGDEPVRMFLDALGELLTTQKATLCNLDRFPDCVPGEGMCGYEDDQYTYLIPGTVFGMVQRHYMEQGRTFPISAAQLWKRMAERGLVLPDVDQRPTRRKALGNGQRLRLVWLVK